MSKPGWIIAVVALSSSIACSRQSATAARRRSRIAADLQRVALYKEEHGR